VIDPAYLAEEEGRRELFAWFLQALGGYAVRGRRLLEIGSNVGLFLRVASDGGWEARGIEPSKWAVQMGREHYGVDLWEGTMEELEQPDGSADMIVMLDVLEHLIDPLSSLKRLRSLLDDEGLLVLSTVDLSGLHSRLRGGAWPWFIRSHLHYFSPEILHSMLRLSGFRMVEWDTVPRSFHLSYLAHRAASTLGPLGKAMDKVARVFDPRVPVGWLGDITFVAARPAAA
jgi:SAM-dependent methyltransferase